MSIVTKTGDKGETSLMYGRRVPKSDPRVDAYGCVDELSAALGLARAVCNDKFVSEQIFAVQKDLIIVMGELATVAEDRQRYLKDGFQVTSEKMVDRITAVIVDLEKDKSLYPKDWVIPGGTAVSAALDRHHLGTGNACRPRPGHAPTWPTSRALRETRGWELRFSCLIG